MTNLAVLRNFGEALSTTISLPLAAIRQGWSDYQLGRDVRRETALSQARCIDRTRMNDEDNDNDDTEADRCRRRWRLRRDQEYPWRIERDIKGDTNWRATWVLEVKDLHDIEWETRRVHDGRKWRWHSIPQGHWPFPYEKTTPDEAEDSKVQ